MSLTKICNNNIKSFVLFVCLWFLSYNETESKLLSYQSEYEVSLGDTDIVRVPGKTYVDKAYGQLFIDWINNCDNSWVSNQRMMTRFINSYGVGTVNEINYSINENINGENMEFVLEVKENAELVERTIGKAIKDNNLVVKFPQTDKKDLTFPNDVVFPHTFLKEITNKLNGEEKIIVKKVYPSEVKNKFKKLRMSYYKDNESTPIFEQTVHLNNQGIASYFRYDYPDYSLVLKLKKISTVKLNCN